MPYLSVQESLHLIDRSTLNLPWGGGTPSLPLPSTRNAPQDPLLSGIFPLSLSITIPLRSHRKMRLFQRRSPRPPEDVVPASRRMPDRAGRSQEPSPIRVDAVQSSAYLATTPWYHGFRRTSGIHLLLDRQIRGIWSREIAWLGSRRAEADRPQQGRR